MQLGAARCSPSKKLCLRWLQREDGNDEFTALEDMLIPTLIDSQNPFPPFSCGLESIVRVNVRQQWWCWNNIGRRCWLCPTLLGTLGQYSWGLLDDINIAFYVDQRTSENSFWKRFWRQHLKRYSFVIADKLRTAESQLAAVAAEIWQFFTRAIKDEQVTLSYWCICQGKSARPRLHSQCAHRSLLFVL